jgi:hypothetical protein
MRTALQHVEWRVGDRTDSEHLVDLKRIRVEASQLFAAQAHHRVDFKCNDRGTASGAGGCLLVRVLSRAQFRAGTFSFPCTSVFSARLRNFAVAV